MILPRHPDQMSDSDLQGWVHGLIDRETPESIFLDYKQTANTATRSEKREIAKDVSSFANERGGVILYGIPEQESGSGEPIPAKPIGMAPIPGLPEIIENILVDVLTPALPEVRIREIPWEEQPKKVVYLAWQPESWEAPHMIHSYDEHYYYRRGNYRAIVMEEGEVERRYIRRQRRRALATEFLAEADFGEALFDPKEAALRLVVCPALPFANRLDFSTHGWRTWLMAHQFEQGLGWIPFTNGVRYYRITESEQQRWLRETRLFRNGAASFYTNYAVLDECYIRGLPFLRRLEKILKLVGAFYESAAMAGNVLVEVAFLKVKDLEFLAGTSTQRPLASDLQCHTERLRFQLRANAASLVADDERWALERRIMDRLAQCFGIWEIPEYFDDDGGPKF